MVRTFLVFYFYEKTMASLYTYVTLCNGVVFLMHAHAADQATRPGP